jgi:hypothetical protein
MSRSRNTFPRMIALAFTLCGAPAAVADPAILGGSAPIPPPYANAPIAAQVFPWMAAYRHAQLCAESHMIYEAPTWLPCTLKQRA